MALVAVADNVQHHLVVVVAFSFAAVFIEGQQVFAEELVQVVPFPFVAEGAQLGQDVAEAGEEAVVACVRQGVDDLGRGIAFAGAGAPKVHDAHALFFHFLVVVYVLQARIGDERVLSVVVGKVPVAHSVQPAEGLAAVFIPDQGISVSFDFGLFCRFCFAHSSSCFL